jgi:tRNA G18 (ribose-2'-O)-methylase SpoU
VHYINLSTPSNLDTPDLKIFKTMRDNGFDDKNSFVADSPKVVNILLRTDIEIKSILATKEYFEKYKELIDKKNIKKLFVAPKELMQSIVGHKIHHNCMAHGIRPQQNSLDKLDNQILMLDEITSTENIGSIARSMAGFGVSSYLLSKRSPHPYSRRSLRVSMGYISNLKYNIYDDIISTCQELKKLGYKIFAAEVSSNSTPLWDVIVPDRWVLIMGHEGRGISQDVLDICDEIVTIEMQDDVKSFNVAVAASVMLYRFTR